MCWNWNKNNLTIWILNQGCSVGGHIRNHLSNGRWAASMFRKCQCRLLWHSPSGRPRAACTVWRRAGNPLLGVVPLRRSWPGERRQQSSYRRRPLHRRRSRWAALGVEAVVVRSSVSWSVATVARHLGGGGAFQAPCRRIQFQRMAKVESCNNLTICSGCRLTPVVELSRVVGLRWCVIAAALVFL